MNGPYCTWRTCRALAVVIHRGESGTGNNYRLESGGACAAHNQQVHDRCARAGPVTSRTVPAANEPAHPPEPTLF